MILESDHPEFWNAINHIGYKSGWQSPLHTRTALNFYRQRPADDGNSISDRSFVLLWEKEPVICFQGANVEINGKNNLVAYEPPCISIENKEKLTANASKTFIKEFEKVSEEVNSYISYRDLLIDGELSTLSRHLLSKGAKATPVFSKMIDLNKDELTLKSHLRKSYSSLVNWGLREMNIQILDYSNVTWEYINDFRELHIREAGRETRSEESWRRQFEMVQANEAFVVLGHLNNELVSAGFFMYSDTICFYGVSASRRDLFEKPMFHSLMWSAILHSKKLGCCRFDVGEQLYPNHPFDKPPSKKELAISEFKAGFGGKTTCQLLLTLDRTKIY